MRPVQLLLQVGAVAGALGSIVGLLFTFVPSLKPGASSGTRVVRVPIPGTKQHVTLSMERDAVRHLTFRHYLRENGIPFKYATGDLRRPGIVITYHLEFPGYPKGTPFDVRYQLYRDSDEPNDFVRQQPEQIHLDGDSDYCTCTSDFIALPPGNAIYHVVVGVFRPHAELSHPLIEQRTGPFTATA